jgi:peptidoglycan/xylan/chitin deacetylase (PgdA/CDA1 family)
MQARAVARRAQVRRHRVSALLVAIVVAGVAAGQRGDTSPVGHGASDQAHAPAVRGTPADGSGALVDRRRREDPAVRAVRRVLAYEPVITRGGGRRREIALTFDDGPGPYTPAIVHALARRRAPATFFVVGRQERTFHAATAAAIDAGDAVADHTESHARLATLPAAAQRDELVTPMQWLRKYGLPGSPLLRPPYGSYDADTLAQLKSLGMLLVLWSVDTQDYRRPGVDAIVDRALAQATPGAIILLHDGGGDRAQTVEAVPRIVHRLRLRDYHLVTIPQLLVDDPPRDLQRLPHPRTEG